MKTIIFILGAMFSLCASAQNDSVKVVFDFNENPWNMATCPYFVNEKGKKKWSYPSYDPAESRLDKTTNFTMPVGDDVFTFTVTPADLEQTDYDNAMVRDEDYDESESIIRSYLYMFTGSQMTLTAPKGYRMAKVVFNRYRSWASGGLGQFDYTWTPNTEKVYNQYNEAGEITWTSQAWEGDVTSWSTPVATGATRLRGITVWLLPHDGTAINALPTEKNGVATVTNAAGVVVRHAANVEDATADLPKGVYIVNGKKVFVK